jgi:hypothetical protein
MTEAVIFIALMVRRRSCAVSNHETTLLILRNAAKTPLVRMRDFSIRKPP